MKVIRGSLEGDWGFRYREMLVLSEGHWVFFGGDWGFFGGLVVLLKGTRGSLGGDWEFTRKGLFFLGGMRGLPWRRLEVPVKGTLGFRGVPIYAYPASRNKL